MLLAAGIYLLTCELPYVVTIFLGAFVIGFLGIQARLGRLPWFETKDGKKQRLVLWLEAKIPILRADFYNKHR